MQRGIRVEKLKQPVLGVLGVRPPTPHDTAPNEGTILAFLTSSFPLIHLSLFLSVIPSFLHSFIRLSILKSTMSTFFAQAMPRNHTVDLGDGLVMRWSSKDDMDNVVTLIGESFRVNTEEPVALCHADIRRA